MLIGITGSAGVGKDTVAEFLWKAHRFTRIAFADPMKKATQTIFGLSDEQTWSRDLKEVTIPYWGLSPRRLFQMIGTDAMQTTFGRDVWVKRWKLSYDMVKDTSSVVVPDVRFDTEAIAIRELGGTIINLQRHIDNGLEDDAKAHVSESGIDTKFLDHIIYNDGSFEELFDKVSTYVWGQGRDTVR